MTFRKTWRESVFSKRNESGMKPAPGNTRESGSWPHLNAGRSWPYK